MAVMASETPLNPVASFPEKAQPLPDVATLPDTPAPPQSNGNGTHFDALSDEPSSQNGVPHAELEVSQVSGSAESSALTGNDATVAPVEHAESGISGVAGFLPESASNPAPVAAEPAVITEPPQVLPPVSDIRDEPLVVDPAQAVQAEGPLPGEPSPPADTQPTTQNSTSTPPEDKMDTSEDAPLPNPDAEMLLDQPDEPVASVEPELSGAVSTLPDAPSAEDTPSAAPSQDQPMTGQVRPREEDDDIEPAPKRAKTESGEDDAPDSAPPAPVAPTEQPSNTDPSSAVANASLPAPAPIKPLEAPPLDSSPITDTQSKFLLEQIRKAKKTKNALPYLLPVDPQALNIPQYPEIIKHPMDLKTLEEKLKASSYASADAFMVDFEQMVQNSVIFNGPNHQVTASGYALRAYFHKCVSALPKGDAARGNMTKPKKQSPAPPKPARPARTQSIPAPVAKSPTEKAATGFLNEHGVPIIRRDSSAQNDRPKREIHPPKRDLPAAFRPKKKKAQLELKFCEVVLKELQSVKKNGEINYPFLLPVDPVALNIPNYLKIIKKPMDLDTISKNLKAGHYANAKEFHGDVKLIFSNCYKFNPPSDGVYKLGKQLETVFDVEWSKKDGWIADNQPQSEPATEDEEEDEEEEEEEAPPVDPNFRRMQEIQAQIAALSAEAMSLTQITNKRASPKAPNKTKAPKTGSAKSKPSKKKADKLDYDTKATKSKSKPKPKRLTLEQKREVSEGIANLDEAKMRKAVQIIRQGVPALAHVQDDELELDIDDIPDEVVYKLHEFVKASLPKKEREPSPEYADDDDDDYQQRSTAGPRRKNKPMKAQEQEERIRKLEAKLQGGEGGSSASPAAAPAESDDEASESSEEE